MAIYSGFTHWKWWVSQRVDIFLCRFRNVMTDQIAATEFVAIQGNGAQSGTVWNRSSSSAKKGTPVRFRDVYDPQWNRIYPGISRVIWIALKSLWPHFSGSDSKRWLIPTEPTTYAPLVVVHTTCTGVHVATQASIIVVPLKCPNFGVSITGNCWTNPTH